MTFNNVLHVIQGNAQLALSHNMEKNESLIENSLCKIINGCEQAASNIEKLLLFSKGGIYKQDVLSISSGMKEWIDTFISNFPSTIEIKTKISEQLPCIQVDSNQLNQVLINLCFNSKDAMQDKGILTIGANLLSVRGGKDNLSNFNTNQNETGIYEKCFCSQQHDGEFVEVTVKDTGLGILKTDLINIFIPFYSTKEVGKGTGMGLAMVYGFMENSGGHILVETELDQGTTFHLYFPVIDNYVPEEKITSNNKDEKQMSEKIKNTRILFVDDESLILELYKTYLTGCDYKVKTANNGIKALALFEKEPDQFDLVITDQTMPKMTGIELAERILEIRQNIPVIITSGNVTEEFNTKAKKIGAREVVRKPFSPDVLLVKIKLLMSEGN